MSMFGDPQRMIAAPGPHQKPSRRRQEAAYATFDEDARAVRFLLSTSRPARIVATHTARGGENMYAVEDSQVSITGLDLQ